MCAELRDRDKPAFSKVNPANANGISKTSNSDASVGTLAPLFWNVLAGYEDKADHLNGNARQAKSGLRRERVKQPDGRYRNKPSGWHEEETR